MKNIDVTALGELLVDFTESGLSPQGNPLLEANPGGAPCNVLSMLNKLGHSTSFIGRIGNDMFGDMLEKTLYNAGIGTQGLVKDDKVNTTLAFVHTREDGDREFSFYRNPGADMMLSPEDVKQELITESRIFHFGTLSMTHDTCLRATEKAIEAACEGGCIISFDPNIREPLWDDMERAGLRTDFGMKHCDILKISDNEILWFTGEKSFDAAVDRILEEYSNISLLLLSLGKDGSMAVCGENKVTVPAFVNPNTIETTGAGDTFGACVLHYVLEHLPKEWEGKPSEFRLDFSEHQLKEMLAFANAAASIITTRKGALKVMPEAAEVEDLVRKYQSA